MAVNIPTWIEENKHFFVPPVCNKLMHGAGQMKVMYIGGPNQRKDYHIDEGEEFFHQVKGDMVLKVVEKGVHKDIPIKEGEVFLLPSRVPHSPQRYENTVGFVMERERAKDELDGLRYYIDGTTDPLWEEWFYCYDLGTQLGPLIKSYFASEEHKTGKPPEGKVFPPPPVTLDTTTTLMKPFSLKQWLADNAAEINQNGSKLLFGEKGEFKEGESKVVYDRGEVTLGPNDSLLLLAGEKFTAKRGAGAICITVTTDPLANK